MLKINTVRFGEIEIGEEKLITFEAGLPGMEGLKRFTLISADETAPFHWIQSMDDPVISLAVINPFELFPDYDPVVPETLFEELQVDDETKLLVLAVSVIPEEYSGMTTNLLAPLVINTANNKGAQVIMDASNYNLREPIFERVREYLTGGGPDAGSDA